MTRWGGSGEDYPDWHPDPMRPFSGGDYPDVEAGIPSQVFVQRLWFAPRVADQPDRDQAMLHELTRNGQRFVDEYLLHGVRGIAPPPRPRLLPPDREAIANDARSGENPSTAPLVRTPEARGVRSLTLGLRLLALFVPKKDRGMIEDAAHDLTSRLRQMSADGAGNYRLAFRAAVDTLSVAAPYTLDALLFLGSRVLPVLEWALRHC